MSQPGRLVPAQSKEPRQPPCPTDLIWHFREKLRIPEIDDVLCGNIRQRQVRWSATLALSCFCSGPTTARTTHDGVEDKTFPKDTSLLAGGRQDLVRIEEFQGRIVTARAAGREYDLLVVARTEALIADLGLRRGLRRAHACSEAGAEMILVHCKQKTPEELVSARVFCCTIRHDEDEAPRWFGFG